MSETCTHHPDRAALDHCVECGSAVCAECRTAVAGKPVCRPCVETIRTRVAAQMDTNNHVAPAPTTMGAYAPPAAPAAPLADAAPLRPDRLLIGIVLGLVVGLIGALIYDKFVFYTNIQWGLITSFIGFGVGMAVLIGTGRGGLVPALIGGALALFAMIVSQYLLFNDALGREMAQNGDMARQFAEKGMTNFRLPFTINGLWFVISNLDVMDWVFIAIGVYGGFKTPFRATPASPAPAAS